jgi:hypothetical protein
MPPRMVREYLFSDDCADRTLLKGVVGALAAQLGWSCARPDGGPADRTAARLYGRDGCFETGQRRGVSDDRSLNRLALLALERALTRRTRVRSCRLIGDRLHSRSTQLSLFSDPATAEREKAPERPWTGYAGGSVGICSGWAASRPALMFRSGHGSAPGPLIFFAAARHCLARRFVPPGRQLWL